MTDIFLSYANVDADRAEPIAKALEDRGWSVWWDPKVPAGKTWDEVIEEHLEGHEPFDEWRQLAAGDQRIEVRLKPVVGAATAGAFKTWTEPTTGLELVDLPGGCFQMGSPDSEDGRGGNEKQHRVCVEPFALATTEVSNAQYRLFKSRHDSGSYKDHSLNGDDQPVVEVSWNDAVDYAEWLSKQTGQRFRLPTEAEWEYAARAGTTTARFWGDASDAACRFANVADQSGKKQFSNWTVHDCDDGHVVTAPVGVFKPNEFGLYDVLGNVWEWGCSQYQSPYDGAEKECVSKDHAGGRVLRGGSWSYEPAWVRSADRNFGSPDNRNNFVGFRLAQDK